MKYLLKHLLAFALEAAVLLPGTSFSQISEPDTVFYGQVINRSSGQVDILGQGKLVWTIVRPDGKTINLTAQLQPLNNGQYSYRLPVPHQALTYGLTASTSVVPLTAIASDCSHLLITVDGTPASIIAPGKSTFSVAESARAATYRLDLELFSPLADSAGDGIPDWWKAANGVINPNADPDGDGWSNLQEFQNGGNPQRDNRIPSLAANEYWVYAEGTTALPLTAVDSDSTATNLHYTLTVLPGVGSFFLHNVATNGGITDVPLAVNDSFTQDDVNQGRLLFVHTQTNAPAVPVTFTVNLRDENPAHGSNFVVTLNVFRPNYPDSITGAAQADAAAPVGCADVPGLAFGEQQMLINYYLSRDYGYILADTSRATAAHTVKAASALAVASLDRSYVLAAGAGNDRLVGGTTNDILIAGRGKVSLRGNGGSDLFVLPSTNANAAMIEDFSVASGDALDISRLLQGSSTQLTNYVQLVTVGTNSVLRLNFNGQGNTYSNMAVTLQGVQLSSTNLRSLVDNSNLLTGNKALSPVISISASIAAASQNGPVSGQFTLARSGSLASPLSVSLTISGSAVNGGSYELLPNAVTFPANQRTLALPINPYPNGISVTQYVQVAVSAGTGYDVGTPSSAQVTIEPLLPQITIEAITPYATKSDMSPGTFLISRSGIYDRSVTVRLNIGGTASSSTDYNSISTAIILNPNVTAALISVTPKSTANITGVPRFVQIGIKPDPTYKVMNPSSDRVFIVDQLLTHDAWQARYFASSTEDWASFAYRDSGNTGIQNLYRYAYGLNPTNPAPTNGLPAYQILNNHLCVTFRRPLTVTDYDYVVEVSDDLVHWSALDADVQSFTPSNANTNDFETMSFRSTATVNGTPKQFMRVLLQPH